MQSVISVGGFHIYLFGITIALGILAGYYLVDREVKRKQLDDEIFSNLVLFVIFFSVIGARLYYVAVFNLDFYLSNPMNILFIRNGGMSIQGGILGGVLAGGAYLRFKKAPFKAYADAFVPGLAFGQFVGRLGCDVYGVAMKTAYPWGVTINGQLLHPAQIYEALLNLLLFAVLWTRKEKTRFSGQLFVEYLIGFSIIRGAIEFFRSNPIWMANLTVAHLTSLVMLVIAVVLYFVFKKQGDGSQEENHEQRNTPSFRFYGLMVLLAVVSTYLFYLLRG